MTKDDEAAQAAGDALEQALLKAARVVELELARIVKSGEDDFDRLANRIAETLARLAVDGAMGAFFDHGPVSASTGEGAHGSINQVAALVARAARRGARFT